MSNTIIDAHNCIASNVKRFSSPRLSSVAVTAIISLYFVTVLNYPISVKLMRILQDLNQFDAGIVFAIAALFFALFNILFTLVALPYIQKPACIILLLVSSVVAYTMYSYGTVYDSNMIETFAESNQAEAMSYISGPLLASLLITGLLPALYLLRCKIKYQPFFKELFHKTISLIFSTAIIVLVYFSYAIDIAAIGRNNPHLDQDIVPYYYLKHTARFIDKKFFAPQLQFTKIQNNANFVVRNRPKLAVFVVGETARADHFGANGYARDTTPAMQARGVISFAQVESCGTLTAVSVPCMFSHMTRKNSISDSIRFEENALDVMASAGVNVLWLENDGGCKGVCDRIPTHVIDHHDAPEFCDDSGCLDEALAIKLESVIDSFMAGTQAGAIFLHAQGSHGPTYYQRYDRSHAKFQPDCQRSDIQNCTQEELVNSYDNTLVYTDYLVEKLINTLERRQAQFDTALMYISDHGESLGEKGMYLHGSPFFIAPTEQTHIPWMVWLSPAYRAANFISEDCLRNDAANRQYSHDNWFHTLMGLMGVNSSAYDSRMDVLSHCTKNT